MPYKNKASRAANDAKKKPRLEWQVVIVPPRMLQETLQALTDERWRVFAVTSHESALLVSAYLTASNRDEPEGDDPA